MQKGRVFAFGLLAESEMIVTDKEKNWFLQWAKINDFVARCRRSAIESPVKDVSYKICSKIEVEISQYTAFIP